MNTLYFIILIFVAAFALKGAGKYEGRSAQEWFEQYSYWEDKYYSLKDCVEFESGHDQPAEEVESNCL